MDDNNDRQCSRCGKWFDEFYMAKNRNRCKKCMSEYQREYLQSRGMAPIYFDTPRQVESPQKNIISQKSPSQKLNIVSTVNTTEGSTSTISTSTTPTTEQFNILDQRTISIEQDIQTMNENVHIVNGGIQKVSKDIHKVSEDVQKVGADVIETRDNLKNAMDNGRRIIQEYNQILSQMQRKLEKMSFNHNRLINHLQHNLLLK
jgi:methyl-accepting chemotaxis protein